MGTVLEYTEEQFHSIFSLCSNVLNSKGAHVSAVSWTWSIHTGNWCGRLFFAIHELRERSPKPWFTLSTHFLVEQQSGQLSLCHVDVRSALEPWLSCPDQGFVQRSPGPFCCPAFQDHSKTCFHWMHLCPLFLLASLSPVSQEWPFSCIVSLCLPLDFLLSAGQCVEGELCASCQVSSEGLILCAGDTNLEVFMKRPQIAITSSEIHK